MWTNWWTNSLVGPTRAPKNGRSWSWSCWTHGLGLVLDQKFLVLDSSSWVEQWTPIPYLLLAWTKAKTSSQIGTLVLALGLRVNNLGLGFKHIPPPHLLGGTKTKTLPKWWLCCPQSPNWRPPLLSSHPQLSGLGRLSDFIGIFKTNKFLWSKAPKKPNRDRKYHDNYSKLLLNGCSL